MRIYDIIILHYFHLNPPQGDRIIGMDISGRLSPKDLIEQLGQEVDAISRDLEGSTADQRTKLIERVGQLAASKE